MNKNKIYTVMLKDYEGNWFTSSGLTKLDDKDIDYILRNYPNIDSSFKQTFDIMSAELSGPNRVDKLIEKEKELMMTDSRYYVGEMIACTEKDGKIYAEPSLISDLMFY